MKTEFEFLKKHKNKTVEKIKFPIIEYIWIYNECIMKIASQKKIDSFHSSLYSIFWTKKPNTIATVLIPEIAIQLNEKYLQ